MITNSASPKPRVVRLHDPSKKLRTENLALRARLREVEDLYNRRDSALIRFVRQIELGLEQVRDWRQFLFGTRPSA